MDPALNRPRCRRSPPRENLFEGGYELINLHRLRQDLGRAELTGDKEIGWITTGHRDDRHFRHPSRPVGWGSRREDFANVATP